MLHCSLPLDVRKWQVWKCGFEVCLLVPDESEDYWCGVTVLVMVRLTCFVQMGGNTVCRDVKAKLDRCTEMLTWEGYIGVDVSLCHAGTTGCCRHGKVMLV